MGTSNIIASWWVLYFIIYAQGLTLFAAVFCGNDSIIIGSILFTVALNFKIMGLYYSLAFFAFILGRIAI